MTQDRMEEAKVAHKKFREGTISSAELDEEFDGLRRALQEEPEQGSTRELFQGMNLKRTGIVLGVNFFQQATGQAFSSQYGSFHPTFQRCPFADRPPDFSQVQDS
jgi:hypothetical protein